MWTISRVCCMGFLAWVSVIDLRTRRIPVVLLIVWNLQAVIYRLYQVTGGREDAALFIGGIGVGAAFFLISRVTKEGIGYGDDPDTWNLSWGVGDSGGVGRDVSFAGCSFCDLPDSKEDVSKLRVSLRTVLGGGISAACNLCGKVILQPKMRLYRHISPYTAVRTGVMKRKSTGS